MLLLVLVGTAPAQTLLVVENPGDLSRLVETKIIDEPEDSFFSFQNALSNVHQAQWQLSSDNRFLSLLGSGAFEAPAQGQGKMIKVNWKHLVPPNPVAGTKYYFRVASYQARTILMSNTVVITIRKGDSNMEWKPWTVRMKFPELFAASPMPIEINLRKLRIDDDNGVAQSDPITGQPSIPYLQPYLLVAVIYVDGTTINPVALSTSTVRVDPPRKSVDRNVGGVTIPGVFSGPPRKTQGNVAITDSRGRALQTNSEAEISAAIGHYESSIKPIGLDLQADVEDPIGAVGDNIQEGTAVFVLAIAMRARESPRDAIDKAYDTMILELQNRVNGIVQGMTLKDLKTGKTPALDSSKIATEVSDKAIASAKDATLTSGWFLPPLVFSKVVELAFHDEYIGADFARFSFGQILRAGKDGIDFALTCKKKEDYSGAYRVFGNIRRK